MTEQAPNLDHLENERDINLRETSMVLGYTVTLAGAFFVTVFALYTYFQWEVDRALSAKMLSVGTVELDELRTKEDEALGGKGGAKQSIDAAMRAIASETGSGSK